MALNDNAVFTAAKGYIFTGAVNATAPTEQQIFDFVDHNTTIAGFSLIGHTSRDDLPEFGFDGGDTETKGTWQKDVLREVITEVASDFVGFNLVQFDASTFELYYGSTNAASANSYAPSGAVGGTTEKALLIVLVDGANKIALHSLRSSLRRNDAISLAVDEFGTLPMRATFLTPAAGPPFTWIPGVDTTP